MDTGRDTPEDALLGVIQTCWTGQARIPEGMTHLEAAGRAAALGNYGLTANIVADGYVAGALDLHERSEQLAVARLMVRALGAFAGTQTKLADKTVATLQAGSEVWDKLTGLDRIDPRGSMLHRLHRQVQSVLAADAAARELAQALAPDVAPPSSFAADPTALARALVYLGGNPVSSGCIKFY